MDLQVLHEKTQILKYLRENTGLQIYSIGDLDDFFWPKTIWYALKDSDEIKTIALLYVGMFPPTLLSFYKGESAYSRQLIEKIRGFLPNKLNVHLSPGLIDIFGTENIIDYYGLNYKMILTRAVQALKDKHIRRLSINDLPIINDFFIESYPHNWFDSRMIETNKYFGYFESDKLIGVSGIHVYSSEYRVAALGNIATHPNHRGKQIAYKLTSALCFDLQKSVDYIGLNVKSDNEYAIKCYKKVGFEIIGTYDECYLKNEG
jgi:ribosomal protein S18 acetylase RimI-like enzyme